MNTRYTRLAILSAALLLSACASKPEVVPSSGPRAPTLPDQVQIYQKEPQRYEKLGAVSVSRNEGASWDDRGDATAGYDVQMPGDAGFRLLPEGLGSGARRLGGTFLAPPDLLIAADDQGGLGVDHIRWSWDDANWQDSAGPLLRGPRSMPSSGSVLQTSRGHTRSVSTAWCWP